MMNIKDKVSETAEHMTHAVTETLDKVGHAATEALHKSDHALSNIAHKAKELAVETTDKLKGLGGKADAEPLGPTQPIGDDVKAADDRITSASKNKKPMNGKH